MAEYFDNLLSVDHLFDVTVYITQRNLLLDKVFSASASHRTDYFQNDKKPIYIQAKASSKKIDQVTKSDLVKRCSDAMNTLVNTSNIVKNDYSGLMYISNFLNPLNLDDRIADAYWNPKATELLQKNFDDLPKQGQQFLLDCETKAKYELKKKNYTYSDNYFDWNRLTVASLPLYREKDPYNPEQFNTESRVLITFIEEILTAISESQTYTDNIYHVLISKYFGNSTKTKMVQYKNLCK